MPVTRNASTCTSLVGVLVEPVYINTHKDVYKHARCTRRYIWGCRCIKTYLHARTVESNRRFLLQLLPGKIEIGSPIYARVG